MRLAIARIIVFIALGFILGWWSNDYIYPQDNLRLQLTDTQARLEAREAELEHIKYSRSHNKLRFDRAQHIEQLPEQ